MILRAKACCVPCTGHESISHAMTCHEMCHRGAGLSVSDRPDGSQYMLYFIAVVATTQRMWGTLCSLLFCIGSRCKGNHAS